MTVVRLLPQVVFLGARLPSGEQIDAALQAAHQACVITISVKTEVRCELV